MLTDTTITVFELSTGADSCVVGNPVSVVLELVTGVCLGDAQVAGSGSIFGASGFLGANEHLDLTRVNTHTGLPP